MIRVGAQIEGPVSLGPRCKVGGEVEGSIFQGHANKQHDGYLGHAYLGAWTNLGAATNNSDLKNNYSTVRVWTPEGEVDTGEPFVGLFMGDHSKTAIGTLFNTGTVVGFSTNVFGAGFRPKHVPSFSWGGAGGIVPYELEKALAVARRVMARREVVMEPADEVLFRSVQRSGRGALARVRARRPRLPAPAAWLPARGPLPPIRRGSAPVRPPSARAAGPRRPSRPPG